MQETQEKHPRAIRWFHWLHFPLLALMIWSGILIYWANDVYKISWGRFTLFHFFPDWFYQNFQIDHRLADGMAWHFFLMWIFAVNGIAYVIYTLVSGEWRYLVPNRSSFREAFQVVLHDLHLSKKLPPHRKFNGAQQIAYTGVILMGAGSLVTGLAIFKPIQASGLTALLGGYEAARLEHFILMCGFISFFVIHVLQVMRAGWSNFRAMVSGYETGEKQRTRRSFLTGAVTFIAAISGLAWLFSTPQDDEIPWPLRRVLRFNQGVFQSLFRSEHPAPEFSRVTTTDPRVNGDIGIADNEARADLKYWKLTVTTGDSVLNLSLLDILALPRVETTFDFKCIEGWSEVMTCAGARFSDFLKAHKLGYKESGTAYPFVSLMTPDENYYVSLDMESMLHPQTLLCYEMNGKPLRFENGAPLRLIIPVKYGIKSLKQVGSIQFADSRPPDYWAERGYDWYAGL